MMRDSEDFARLGRFVLELRQCGVTDQKILAAMERTPRAAFAPAHLQAVALDDVALPMAGGQMMTKPSVIGRMLMALDPAPADAVLEVGAGSAWQSAILAQIARKVTALERVRPLAVEARVRCAELRIENLELHGADGRLGWTEGSPYERIIVNACAPAAPLALLDQLAPGGILLLPLGEPGAARLMRFRKGAAAPDDLGPIQFAPLGEGVADET